MRLAVELEIASPAARVWDVVGERFGDVCVWAAPIVTSEVSEKAAAGAVRTCHIARFGPVPAGVVHERLTEFDPEQMALTYEASGLPRFIRRAANRWSVRAKTRETCVVRTHATLELCAAVVPLAPVLAWRMRRDGLRVLEELRHYVEHGSPHPRKLAARVANDGGA